MAGGNSSHSEEEYMKTIIYAIIVFIVGLIIGYLLFGGSIEPLGGYDVDRISSATSTSVLVATSSTRILAANGGRIYAKFCNYDTSYSIFYSFGASTTAALARGIELEAGECEVIDRYNFYVGEIAGIATTSPVRVGIMQND